MPGRKPKVIFTGAIPPPYMGPTLATEVILRSGLRDRFELIHLDTSDHRPLDTLGAIDFQNIYLALKAYVEMLYLILRHWPDLVYIPASQTTIGYLKDSGLILIARVLGRPVVCHLRGGNFGNWVAKASRLTRWYVRQVHGRIQGQIVLGETLKSLFDEVMPRERIHVVPNGKDVHYPPKPAPGDRVTLLYLGNMVRSKGVLDVLAAVRPVYSRCPQAEFVFCGAWEDAGVRSEVEAFLAANPDLPIRWLGTVEGARKADVINASDIFVFPTYYPPEGHPWVIIEAMAAGLPIISCDQGAIVESVLDGENGFIVPHRDPAAIAEAACRLITDAALRQSQGQASLARYRTEFTEARMVERLGNALQAVVDDANRPR